jgi:hypothetical protein
MDLNLDAEICKKHYYVFYPAIALMCHRKPKTPKTPKKPKKRSSYYRLEQGFSFALRLNACLSAALAFCRVLA